MDDFTNKNKNDLIRQIYEGGVTVYSLNKLLPKKLFKGTYKKLLKGVRESFSNYKDPLYLELKANVYVFSGAKIYTEVKDISSLILDGKKLRPFNQFKKLALDKFSLYNKDYLQAEYETAVGQAQTAVKWQQIEKEAKIFPYLQRKAVMDVNTSDDCKILNDIIAPVGDKFWNTRSPLTHFRCRCILVQIDKYEDVKLSSREKINDAIKETENINPLFKGNPGKDKVVFNDSHPYFDIEPKDKALAKKNFNL